MTTYYAAEPVHLSFANPEDKPFITVGPKGYTAKNADEENALASSHAAGAVTVTKPTKKAEE